MTRVHYGSGAYGSGNYGVPEATFVDATAQAAGQSGALFNPTRVQDGAGSAAGQSTAVVAAIRVALGQMAAAGQSGHAADFTRVVFGDGSCAATSGISVVLVGTMYSGGSAGASSSAEARPSLQVAASSIILATSSATAALERLWGDETTPDEDWAEAPEDGGVWTDVTPAPSPWA